MGTVSVKVTFEHGSGTAYDFPHVFSISDPKEGIKGTLISGNRGDGSIYIPGGRKSQEIVIRGNLISTNYIDLTTLIDAMRSGVTTDVGTLTLQYFASGSWNPSWVYTVRRIEEITWSESLRIDYQEYECRFMVLSY